MGERHAPQARPRAPLRWPSCFGAHRDRVLLDPDTAACQLRVFTLAVSHPALIAEKTLSPAEIVSLLLDGIRARRGAHRPLEAPC